MSTIAGRIKELNDWLVGTEASYEGWRGKQHKSVEGIVQVVEFAGCQITNDRGSFLGLRLLIKPKGKRAVWTWATADEYAIPAPPGGEE